MLAENEVPIKTSQYLMGHSSIELTANVYTDVTNKLLANSAEKNQKIADLVHDFSVNAEYT